LIVFAIGISGDANVIVLDLARVQVHPLIFVCVLFIPEDNGAGREIFIFISATRTRTNTDNTNPSGKESQRPVLNAEL